MLKTNRPSTPLFATINVTGVCNLSCQYCFNEPRLHEHMPIDDYERVLNALRDANLFFVILSGGEPFAHPEISRFLIMAHESFKYVLTLTNGTTIKEEHIETIKSIASKKGGFPIQVSLDSTDERINNKVRGKTLEVKKNIDRLIKAGASVTIAMVITKTNSKNVIAAIRELSEKIYSFHVMPIKEVKTSKIFDHSELLSAEELDVIWEKLISLRDELGIDVRIPKEETQKNQGCALGAPCMAGFSEFVIDPNLEVRPCDRVVDYFIGNLKQDTVSDIWNGDKLRTVTNNAIPYCRSSDKQCLNQ